MWNPKKYVFLIKKCAFWTEIFLFWFIVSFLLYTSFCRDIFIVTFWKVIVTFWTSFSLKKQSWHLKNVIVTFEKVIVTFWPQKKSSWHFDVWEKALANTLTNLKQRFFFFFFFFRPSWDLGPKEKALVHSTKAFSFGHFSAFGHQSEKKSSWHLGQKKSSWHLGLENNTMIFGMFKLFLDLSLRGV